MLIILLLLILLINRNFRELKYLSLYRAMIPLLRLITMMVNLYIKYYIIQEPAMVVSVPCTLATIC